MRRLSFEEAAFVWRELLGGRWSIVDRFDDESGRRFVLVHRTSARPARPWNLLSRRERTIVAHVAAGEPNRVIAAALGISISTVAGHLRAARRKLDGARRIELVREWPTVASAVEGDEVTMAGAAARTYR